MANKTIAELTAASTPLDGTELVHVVQGGNSRKVDSKELLKPTLSAADQAASRAAISAALVGHINGLGLSINVTDTANDIDIAAGEAASSQTSPVLMVYAGATGRQIDVAYGTGSGVRFDSSVSDGTWYIFLISNGTATAIGLSKSADPTGQANYPSGYTHYRIIGYLVRASGVNSVPVRFAKPEMYLVGDAPVFGCRVWVNFNGTTGAISASGNVASITKNGTGDYTINFATALPDAKYAVSVSGPAVSGANHDYAVHIAGSAAGATTKTTTALRITCGTITSAANADMAELSVMVFR